MFTWKIINKLIYQAFILFTAIPNLSKVGSQILTNANTNVKSGHTTSAQSKHKFIWIECRTKGAK